MRSRLLITAVLLAGLAAGLALALVQRQIASERSAATLFDTPRTLPTLQLTDHRGEALRPASLTGQWDVLFFGFTHCPDICPATLVRLDTMLDELGAAAGRTRVWLVTVDPARDTPEVLDDYVRYFDPNFGAITGSEEAIAAFAQALGVAYSRIPDADGYTMSHSAALFLIDPDGHYAGVFNTPHDWPQIAADLRALVR